MISVNVDMRNASTEEREIFFSLPHVGGAIDSMVTIGSDTIVVRLTDDNGQGFASEPVFEAGSHKETGNYL